MSFNSFSEVLVALKDKKKTRRCLWPEGVYIFIVPGSEFTVNRYPLSTIYPEGSQVQYAPHIDVAYEDEDGKKFVSTWSPQNEDLLAEDWEISEL